MKSYVCHLCLVVTMMPFCHTRQSEECFWLTQNRDDMTYNWDRVRSKLNLTLSCKSSTEDGFIFVESVVHSIPLREDQYCPMTTKCAANNVETTACRCCNSTAVQKCEEEVIADSNDIKRICNSYKQCRVEVRQQSLVSTCRSSVDYNCTEEGTCNSRWVKVTYVCKTDAQMMFGIQSAGSTFRILTIALTVTVAMLLLIIVMTVAIFCLRYRRLERSYTEGRHLVSKPGLKEMGNTKEPSVFYRADQQIPVTLQNGGNVMPNYDNCEPNYLHDAPPNPGSPTDCEEGASDDLSTLLPDRSHTKRASYVNVKEPSPDPEYTNVERELKAKNRPGDIDHSNVWHDPDKPLSGGLDGTGSKSTGKRVRVKGDHGYEEVELIDNEEYAGQNAPSVTSGPDTQKTRHRTADTGRDGDYETM